MFSPFGAAVLKTEGKRMNTNSRTQFWWLQNFSNTERSCKRLHMNLAWFPCVKATRLCDTLICLGFLTMLFPPPPKPPGQAKPNSSSFFLAIWSYDKHDKFLLCMVWILLICQLLSSHYKAAFIWRFSLECEISLSLNYILPNPPSVCSWNRVCSQ